MAIQALIDGQQALIDALDTGEAHDIEAATVQVQDAVDRIRSIGGWHATPELREALRTALGLGDAARIRTGYHTDRTSRRLSMIATLRRPAAVPGYGRNGGFRLAGL